MKKCIIVAKCSQCLANQCGLCLADMDLDYELPEEGFHKDCPLPDYIQPELSITGDSKTENKPQNL